MSSEHDLEAGDRLLVEANASVTPPPDLVDRIERRLRQRGGRWRSGALAAAAVFALAVGGWWVLGRLPRTTAPQPAPETPLVAAQPAARVELAPESPLFARPIASQHPDVSIVLLYRTANPPASPPADRSEP